MNQTNYLRRLTRTQCLKACLKFRPIVNVVVVVVVIVVVVPVTNGRLNIALGVLELRMHLGM